MDILRIFVADASDVLRRGLRSLLSSHSGWSVCGEAKNALDAVRQVAETKPDVVIMGLEPHELNGIETIRQIKQAQPSTEVLFYTTHNEESMVIGALRAGARAHVLKSDSEESLLEAVATVAAHIPFFSSKAVEVLVKHVRNQREMNATAILTSRELEIVQLLSDGKSNRDVSVELHISVKTVEAHRAAIMRKLGFHSLTELVRYAIRNGIIEL